MGRQAVFLVLEQLIEGGSEGIGLGQRHRHRGIIANVAVATDHGGAGPEVAPALLGELFEAVEVGEEAGSDLANGQLTAADFEMFPITLVSSPEPAARNSWPTARRPAIDSAFHMSCFS